MLRGLIMNNESYVVCCKKCPNKKIKFGFCYNGKSGFDCPSYNLLDHLDNEPPEDIEIMVEAQ